MNHIITVNREYFIVKIFSDRLSRVKIKCTKHMRTSNGNVVGVVCPKII